MPVSQENSNNLEPIENILCEVEEKLKEAISLSLEAVNKAPNAEKELFSLYKKHGNSLRDYFIYYAEKSGNSALGKKIFRSVIFKRF
ncbi:hypothetical protein [Anaeromicrobium sediminis]|uniref:Uncharacterized protein n=1 Tax=Anaeromicrobium sediminis TaxID=1478221 RepID=A0A267MND0_9FIRM|nr:hypothetical protein [Anaeromicrobium sediminis]PAB60385.1 hypothetical protein CCE28_05680 [Anaeromicrobium sediminis]